MKLSFLRKAAAAVVMTLALSGCSLLSTFNALVPKDGGVELAARDVSFGADPRQKLDVYRPKQGDAQGTIVFVYGGSWADGTKGNYAFAARALAARGYVTVVPDYRLVPQVRYPGFVEDVAKATAWASRNAARYGAPAGRLYLVGHSAGAYNVMTVALNPNFLRAEGLPLSTITAAAGLSGPYDFLPLDVPATKAAFAGVKDLPETQPITWARRGGAKPPVFVATGDDDTTVLPRHTTRLAAALRQTGNAVEEEHYPGLDHADTVLALSRPFRGKAPVLDQIMAFFAAHR